MSSDTTGTLRDTVVARNTGPGGAASDIYGPLGSGAATSSYNLIGTGGSGGLVDGVKHNQVGVADPGLGPLQDHGGPTRTMALLPGSPALNAGDPAQLGVADQRGVVRSGGVNIGAYQASATALVVTAPAAVTAGVSFDVTVTAVDPFGQVAVGYTGTVDLYSTDDQAPFLGEHAFTLADAGQYTFAGMTLYTGGPQTLYAFDDGGLFGSADLTVSAPGVPGGRSGHSPVGITFGEMSRSPAEEHSPAA
jgi:hypothetical protein